MNAIKAFPGLTGLFPIKITNNPDLQEILTESFPILRILVNPENPGSEKRKSNNNGLPSTPQERIDTKGFYTTINLKHNITTKSTPNAPTVFGVSQNLTTK